MLNENMIWVRYDPLLNNKPPYNAHVLIKFKSGGYLATHLSDDSDYGDVFPDYESYHGLNEITHYSLITPPICLR